MRRTDMPLMPLDECAQNCCILDHTRDPHGVRVSCRARLLSGMIIELACDQFLFSNLLWGLKLITFSVWLKCLRLAVIII